MSFSHQHSILAEDRPSEPYYRPVILADGTVVKKAVNTKHSAAPSHRHPEHTHSHSHHHRIYYPPDPPAYFTPSHSHTSSDTRPRVTDTSRPRVHSSRPGNTHGHSSSHYPPNSSSSASSSSRHRRRSFSAGLPSPPHSPMHREPLVLDSELLYDRRYTDVHARSRSPDSVEYVAARVRFDDQVRDATRHIRSRGTAVREPISYEHTHRTRP